MKLRELLRGSGFTGGQAVAYLKFTKVFKPPFSFALPQEKIAKKANLTKPELSKLFSSLADKGWLSCRRDVERSKGGRIYESTAQFVDYWDSLRLPQSETPFFSIAEELVGLVPNTGHYLRAIESWGRDVRSRLLAALLIEAADSSGLACNLTRADLVALTGMTYEGVKKSLASMSDQGLLLYISPAKPNYRPAKTLGELFEPARRRLAEEDDDTPEVELPAETRKRGFSNSQLNVYLDLKWLKVENLLGAEYLIKFISDDILTRALMFGALLRDAPDDLALQSETYLQEELSSLGLKLEADMRNWLAVAFRDTKRSRSRVLRGVVNSVELKLRKILKIVGTKEGVDFRHLVSESSKSTFVDDTLHHKSGQGGIEERLIEGLAGLELDSVLKTLRLHCDHRLANKIVTHIACLPLGNSFSQLFVVIKWHEKILAPLKIIHPRKVRFIKKHTKG